MEGVGERPFLAGLGLPRTGPIDGRYPSERRLNPSKSILSAHSVSYCIRRSPRTDSTISADSAITVVVGVVEARAFGVWIHHVDLDHGVLLTLH